MTKISTAAVERNKVREAAQRRREDQNASNAQQEEMRERLAAQSRRLLRAQTQTRLETQGVLIARNGADAQARARAAAARAEAAAGDANPHTRFDSDASYLPGGFFAPFTDGGGSGQGESGLQSADVFAPDGADESLDMLELARMLPTDGNNGVFELLFPSGDSLGVAVSSQASALSYLLSPSNDKLAAKLRQGRMELEDKLGQLTHRNVNITVL